MVSMCSWFHAPLILMLLNPPSTVVWMWEHFFQILHTEFIDHHSVKWINDVPWYHFVCFTLEIYCSVYPLRTQTKVHSTWDSVQIYDLSFSSSAFLHCCCFLASAKIPITAARFALPQTNWHTHTETLSLDIKRNWYTNPIQDLFTGSEGNDVLSTLLTYNTPIQNIKDSHTETELVIL